MPRLVPRHPPAIAVQELPNYVENQGYQITERIIDGDLTTLSGCHLGLLLDDHSSCGKRS